MVMDKAVTIKSIAGPASTILNGSGGGSVVIFNSSAQRDTILDGFTITNGWAEYGGGIVCLENASPSIKNNLIVDNKASLEINPFTTTCCSSKIVGNIKVPLSCL